MKHRDYDWLQTISRPFISQFYPTPSRFPNSLLCLANKDILRLLWTLSSWASYWPCTIRRNCVLISLYFFMALLQSSTCLFFFPPNLEDSTYSLIENKEYLSLDIQVPFYTCPHGLCWHMSFARVRARSFISLCASYSCVMTHMGTQ